jgi:hypothetical protein
VSVQLAAIECRLALVRVRTQATRHTSRLALSDQYNSVSATNHYPNNTSRRISKMFSNLQIRPAKPHRRKPSMAARAGVTKQRRVSQINTNINDVPSMSFMEGLFGDEFPDAFASGGVKGNKSIQDLPAELLAIISQDLSKLDIKRLRLSSKHLATNVDLRIDRLYVSPNRTNLECLKKILDHPRHRLKIIEIVWDDAQLDEYADLESFRNALIIDENEKRTAIEEMLDLAIRDLETEWRTLNSSTTISSTNTAG